MNGPMGTAQGYSGRCAMCGTILQVPTQEWHRELGRCSHCGLNARLRGVIVALCQTAYGDMTAPLMRLPALRSLRVLGISDYDAYASVLTHQFQYVNTYFDSEPVLDICDAAACERFAGNNVVICSDVLEHTRLKPPSVIR